MFLSPAFRRNAERLSFIFQSFRLSLRTPIEVGTLWTQLLLQFYTNIFETSLVFWSWYENMHVVWILSSD